MVVSTKNYLLRLFHQGKSPEEIRKLARKKGIDDQKILKTFLLVSNYPQLAFIPQLKKYLNKKENLSFEKKGISLDNYEKIIVQKFEKGERPENIFQACKKAGIPVEKILYEFHEIVQYTTTAYYLEVLNFLQLYEKQLTKKELPKSLYKNQTKHEKLLKTSTVWDPSGNIIRDNFFNEKQGREWKQILYYKKNPFAPHKNILFLSSFSFLSFIIGTITVFFLGELLVPNLLVFLYSILSIPFVALTKYYRSLKQLECDGVKMLIAQDKNWIYSPSQSILHATNFRSKFFELFTSKNRISYISDEFWGKFQKEDFWVGDIDNEKSAVTVKLNKKLRDTLLLVPSRSLKSQIIGVASNSVSAAFDIKLYKNRKQKNHQIEILKKLSPFVQDKMFNLLNEEGSYSILFKKDCVVFLFPQKFLEETTTNFLQEVAIAKSDKVYLQNKLENILAITHEFGKYLK